jgi:hypothetical protein
MPPSCEAKGVIEGPAPGGADRSPRDLQWPADPPKGRFGRPEGAREARLTA